MGRFFEKRLKRMHQLIESMEGPTGLKKVESIEQYVQENNFDWKPCFKFKSIQVRPAQPGEQVQTILADGTKETEPRIAEEGDFVVKNLVGPEQWIMKPNVLAKKYVKTDKPGIFKPKGGPMLAAELHETIEFQPPMWGGDTQTVKAGGFLLMDPSNNKDIYGIGKEEFFDTYKFGNSQ